MKQIIIILLISPTMLFAVSNKNDLPEIDTEKDSIEIDSTIYIHIS
jgi:hypothetical protein